MHRIATGYIAFVFLFTASVKAQRVTPGAYGSSSPVNYVRTWNAVKPDTNVNSFTVNANLSVAVMSTDYIDGLGRPVEKVVKGGSLVSGSTPVDMVSATVYDELGREQYKYLPFAANTTGTNSSINDGMFKLNPFQQDSTFNKNQFPDEAYFYGQTDFEASPLNRPLKTYAPGNSWVGAARGMEVKYWYNTVTDSVRLWKVTDNSNGFGSYTTTSCYAAGALFKEVAIDEHGKQVVVFKDKEGLVLLKKVQLTAMADSGGGKDYTGWLCTYYIYDQFSRLRCVVQPRGVELLSQNGWVMTALGNVILDEQCFLYEYDYRGRIIKRKIPGIGQVWMVYDAHDRLVMSQDSAMRSNHQWQYSQYDSLDRIIVTGLLIDNSNYNNLSYHSVRADTSILYPNLSGYSTDELTRTFYDDYSWRGSYGNPLSNTINSGINGSGNNNFLTPSNTTWPYPQPLSQSLKVTGLMTGIRAKVLGSSKYLYTIYFYDDRANVIQIQETNITDSIDVNTVQYSWNGPVLMTLKKHSKADPNKQTILAATKYTYDSLWRIVKVEMKASHSQINAGAMPTSWKTIAQNYYNAIGDLVKKKQGIDPGNSANSLDSLMYDYNIRGWLLGMNRNYVKDTTSTSNYFGFELGYDKINFQINGNTKSYANAQYNGNITGMLWKSTGDDQIRKYDFSYDAANRLTTADFTQLTNNSFNKAAGLDFSLYGLTYDANGNILTLNQRGWKVGGSATIDSLLYTYAANGNKLINVLDRRNDTATILGDFRSSKLYMATLGSKTASAADYSYDGNGNPTIDNNKDISFIHYNYMNLPDSIVMTGKGNIKYVYDATGIKLKKIVTEGENSTTTLYLLGTYLNDTLQFLGQDEGRIRKKDTSQLVFDYFIKDYQGNVRMVLTEDQRTDTYPAATMELADSVRDNAYYSNIDLTRSGLPSGYPVDTSYSNPNNRVAKVSGSGNKIGPGIILKVMAGDRFNLRVSSWYKKNGVTPGTPINPVADLATALTNSIGSLSVGHASIYQLQTNSTLTPGALTFYNTHSSSDSITKPKAFVNWILFDEQFNYVASNSGFEQVGADNTSSPTVHLRNNMPVDRNGYLYVYVSNETPNIDVYFDNLQVTHIRGPELDENHYYPFGLSMNAISSKANTFGAPQNAFKFNGGAELAKSEFSDGSGLEAYESGFRTYDPQLGRFFQVDPLAVLNVDWSPYTFVNDNPILFNDYMGLDTTIDNVSLTTSEYNSWVTVDAKKPKDNTQKSKDNTQAPNAAPAPPTVAFVGGAIGGSNIWEAGGLATETEIGAGGLSTDVGAGTAFEAETIGASASASFLAALGVLLPLEAGPSGEGQEYFRRLEEIRDQSKPFNGHGNRKDNTNPHIIYSFTFTPNDSKTPVIKYGISDYTRYGFSRVTKQLAKYLSLYGPTVKPNLMGWEPNRQQALAKEQNLVNEHNRVWRENPRDQNRPQAEDFFE